MIAFLFYHAMYSKISCTLKPHDSVGSRHTHARYHPNTNDALQEFNTRDCITVQALIAIAMLPFQAHDQLIIVAVNSPATPLIFTVPITSTDISSGSTLATATSRCRRRRRGRPLRLTTSRASGVLADHLSHALPLRDGRVRVLGSDSGTTRVLWVSLTCGHPLKSLAMPR